MSNEQPDKKKGILKEKGVEIVIGLVLTIISIFIINRIDRNSETSKAIEIDMASVKTSLEIISENQGTLLGNDGDNTLDLISLKLRVKDLEEDVAKLEEEIEELKKK